MSLVVITGNGTSLTRVRFASVINGSFVYNEGESDGTVFPGTV